MIRRNAKKDVREIAPSVSSSPAKIYVTTIYVGEILDFENVLFLTTTKEKAIKQLADWCKKEWNSKYEGLMPKNDKEIITKYFSNNEDMRYETTHCEIDTKQHIAIGRYSFTVSDNDPDLENDNDAWRKTIVEAEKLF